MNVQAYCPLCGHQVMAISQGNGVLRCAVCLSYCYGKEVCHVTSTDTPEPDINSPVVYEARSDVVPGRGGLIPPTGTE